MDRQCSSCSGFCRKSGCERENAKQKKEWVGLSDEFYERLAEKHVTNCYFDTLAYAKAIEAKLRENNV